MAASIAYTGFPPEPPQPVQLRQNKKPAAEAPGAAGEEKKPVLPARKKIAFGGSEFSTFQRQESEEVPPCNLPRLTYAHSRSRSER